MTTAEAVDSVMADAKPLHLCGSFTDPAAKLSRLRPRIRDTQTRINASVPGLGNSRWAPVTGDTVV